MLRTIFTVSYLLLTLITILITFLGIVEAKEAGYGFIVITLLMLVVYLKIELIRENNNKRRWIVYAKDLIEQNENLRRWRQ